MLRRTILQIPIAMFATAVAHQRTGPGGAGWAGCACAGPCRSADGAVDTGLS